MLAACGSAPKPPAVPSARAAAAAPPPSCRVAVHRVSTPGGGAQHPQLAGGGDGFAVAWEESAEHRSVRLQRFGGDAQPLGPVVEVGDHGGAEPRVAALAGGGFAVFWSTEQDGRALIAMRRFDRAGKPLGDTVPVVVSPGARTLALAPVDDGFALAWWNWSGLPHQISVSWLDKEGRALGRALPITRAPSADPTVDLWPGAAVGSRAPAVIAWEEVVDGHEHILVGELAHERLQGRVDHGAGETPELGGDVVVFERPTEQRIWMAELAGAVMPVGDGHVPAAAPDGAGATELCFLRDTDPSDEVHIDELWCGTLAGGKLERPTRVAVAQHAIFALQLAVASGRTGVVWQSEEDDDTTVWFAALSCPDAAAAKARR